MSEAKEEAVQIFRDYCKKPLVMENPARSHAKCTIKYKDSNDKHIEKHTTIPALSTALGYLPTDAKCVVITWQTPHSYYLPSFIGYYEKPVVVATIDNVLDEGVAGAIIRPKQAEIYHDRFELTRLRQIIKTLIEKINIAEPSSHRRWQQITDITDKIMYLTNYTSDSKVKNYIRSIVEQTLEELNPSTTPTTLTTTESPAVIQAKENAVKSYRYNFPKPMILENPAKYGARCTIYYGNSNEERKTKIRTIAGRSAAILFLPTDAKDVDILWEAPAKAFFPWLWGYDYPQKVGHISNVLDEGVAGVEVSPVAIEIYRDDFDYDQLRQTITAMIRALDDHNHSMRYEWIQISILVEKLELLVKHTTDPLERKYLQLLITDVTSRPTYLHYQESLRETANS